MGRVSALKYLFVFTLPILVYVAFQSRGWLTFLPMMEAFVLIPILELLFKPNSENLSSEEEEIKKKDWFYDLLIYLIVPVQFAFLWMFLQVIDDPGLFWWERVGRITAMGLMCGVIGINVAHELGHRKQGYEQWMAKLLLMTSLYMHFFIEHNRGHHRHVSTPEDPSSARLGESLYRFWWRSVTMAYRSAWNLEFERLKKKGKPKLSLHNEMLQFQIIQLVLLIAIGAYFSWLVMGYFIAAATMGFLLLETVNYIEHYGLQRSKKGNNYERVMPHHSWNSDHIIGRLMLFELSRHSDHHFIASRKYQILRHIDDTPQMPTGYPGMMLLATFPPLWFTVMNKRLENYRLQKA
jgi:alkane 1-monooxygenase